MYTMLRLECVCTSWTLHNWGQLFVVNPLRKPLSNWFHGVIVHSVNGYWWVNTLIVDHKNDSANVSNTLRECELRIHVLHWLTESEGRGLIVY